MGGRFGGADVRSWRGSIENRLKTGEEDAYILLKNNSDINNCADNSKISRLKCYLDAVIYPPNKRNAN